jgi:hypothetical protein
MTGKPATTSSKRVSTPSQRVTEPPGRITKSSVSSTSSICQWWLGPVRFTSKHAGVIGRLRRRLFGAATGFGLLFGGLGPMTGADAATLDMRHVLRDMRSYCMAELCAGMSVAEIEALPGTTLILDSPLLDDKLCNSRGQRSVNGTFWAQGGERFEVVFFMLPGPGQARDVYRALIVNLRLEGIDSDELDSLSGPLVQRWHLQETGAGWWRVRRPMMEVSVAAQRDPGLLAVVSQLRLTVAPADALAFTANEPWCLGEAVPRLPQARAPLPKL